MFQKGVFSSLQVKQIKQSLGKRNTIEYEDCNKIKKVDKKLTFDYSGTVYSVHESDELRYITYSSWNMQVLHGGDCMGCNHVSERDTILRRIHIGIFNCQRHNGCRKGIKHPQVYCSKGHLSKEKHWLYN